MSSPYEKRPPLPALTGLRFIAAFSVLLAHAMHWIAAIPPEYDFIRRLGNSSGLGMPLFFVLSGFVIHYNYGIYFTALRIPAFARFMIARFARLYPLYIAALMIFFFQKDYLPPPLSLRYYTLTQAWQLSYVGPTWIGHLYLAPAWSISIEWFLYIAYALIGLRLARLKKPAHVIAVFILIAGIYYGGVWAAYHYLNETVNWSVTAYGADARPQHVLYGWIFNIGPIGRSFEFALGALAAQLYLLTRHQLFGMRAQRLIRAALYAAIAASIAIIHNPWDYYPFAFGSNMAAITCPLLAFILYGSTIVTSRFSRAMSCRAMVIGGEASYSIYLLHALFLPEFRIGEVDGPTFKWIFHVVYAIVVILALSLLSYRYFEVPMRRHSRRLLEKAWDRVEALSVRWMRMNSIYPLFGLAFVGTFLWINHPSLHTPLEVAEAHYGDNCEKPAANPTPYLKGNATLGTIQHCLHNDGECRFAVTVDMTGGDPAPGCSKEYDVSYRCRGENRLRHVHVAGEANYRQVTLSCLSPDP